MRPGLGGDRRILEKFIQRADYNVNGSYPNYVVMQNVTFEITEAGLYKAGMQFNVQSPGNNANNEFSPMLMLDGAALLLPRVTIGFGGSVASRDHVFREHVVLLAEGTHLLTVQAYTVGTDSSVLSTYFLDGERVWVDKL